MRNWFLLCLCSAISCDAFLRNNPDYCDASTPCPELSTCDMVKHSCVPAAMMNSTDITLTAMTPNVAGFDGGGSFVLTGTNFRSGAQVKINGIAVIDAQVSSSTEIRGTLPTKSSKACGLTTVTVQNPDSSQSPASSTTLFHYRLLTRSLGAFNSSIPAVDTGASELVLARLDGDNFYDLATVNESSKSFSVFKGSGDLNFQLQGNINAIEPYKHIQAAELAGNTDNVDIVLSNDTAAIIWTNNGLATWDPGVSLTVSNGALTIADFTGDQRNDIATSISSPPRLGVALGHQGFVPQQISMQAGAGSAIVAADFNGDGKQDLALGASQEQAAFVYLGDGAGGFGTQHLDVSLGQPPVAVAAADMDGDGKQDLVVLTMRNSEGALFVLYGNGNGTFRANPPTLPISIPTGGFLLLLTLADLDCDGLPEILFYSNGAKGFTIVPPPENNAFVASSPVSLVTADVVMSIAAAPLDDDHLVDVAVLSGGAIKVYRNTSH